MPIYKYYCPKCDKMLVDYSSKVKTGNMPCPDCGSEAQRQISLVNFKMSEKTARIRDGWTPGYQPNLKMEINSRREYDRELKRRGLVEVGKEEIPEYKPTRKGISEEEMREIVARDEDHEIGGIMAEQLIEESKNPELTPEEKKISEQIPI